MRFLTEHLREDMGRALLFLTKETEEGVVDVAADATSEAAAKKVVNLLIDSHPNVIQDLGRLQLAGEGRRKEQQPPGPGPGDLK